MSFTYHDKPSYFYIYLFFAPLHRSSELVRVASQLRPYYFENLEGLVRSSLDGEYGLTIHYSLYLSDLEEIITRSSNLEFYY